MLKNLSVKTKLRAAFLAVIALLLIAASVGYWGIRSLGDFMTATVHGDIALAQAAADIRSGVLELRRFEKDVFLNVSAADKVASYRDKWQNSRNNLSNDIIAAKKSADDKVGAELSELEQTLSLYTDAFTKVAQSIERGAITAPQQANQEIAVAKDAIRQAEQLADQINDQAITRATAIESVTLDKRNAVSTTLILLTAIGVATAFLLASLITSSITKSLTRASTVAATVAQGRLGNQITVDSHDELGQLLQSLRTMDEKLFAMVSDVLDSATKVDSATREIATGNDDLSQRTQEQASSLEQTAASIEQMTASVQQNATNAAQATALSDGAFKIAERGGHVVQQVVDAMNAISDSSGRMANIVNVIESIAFQTNLLALNAAVEAARAGEQGRGFAVVASEVRNLAQRSASAAREIKDLIDDSSQKVEAGASLAARAGEALEEIVASVRKVNSVVESIATANDQQSSGIQQINNAISQLDEMTQRNAAAVEEISAVSKALQDQAELLTTQAMQFNLSRTSQSTQREIARAA